MCNHASLWVKIRNFVLILKCIVPHPFQCPSSTSFCFTLSFSNIPAQPTLRPTIKNTANKCSHHMFLLKNNTVHGLWLAVYLFTKMQIHSFCVYGLTTTDKYKNYCTRCYLSGPQTQC